MKREATTSAKAHKASRRDIRRAFGPEFQETVETFMVAHEDGLKNHGAMLHEVLLGPFWKRAGWLLFGRRFVGWLIQRRPVAQVMPDGQ